MILSMISKLRGRPRVASTLIVIAVAGAFATGCMKRRSLSESVVKDITTEAEWRGNGSFPIWSYDGGPDPQTPMGRELIELNARVPSFPNLSNAIYGSQMFRPPFGPIAWRMMQKPNSVKILFIGQDGTHIAEAAGRPATAGFGGRAQDLAKYFGVSSSAAFINAYAFTIRWQYGVFDAPIIRLGTGRPQISFGSFTNNQVWLLSQDLRSPIVKWRNDLIRWIIRNNKDSLRMIVLFGGAARDSAASFVIANGGTVGPRTAEADLANIRIPEFGFEGAGGNQQTAIALDKDGRDIYAEFNGGRAINYTDEAARQDLQRRFREAFNADPDTWMEKMVIINSGVSQSGVINPAQIGGYDIARRMEINGQRTISLKGLRISDDVTLENDVLVTQLPHPTALSMMSGEEASRAVAQGLTAFRPYVEAGWSIDADPGFTNSFAAGEPYRYARADMGTEYYDFGAPNSRMVNVSTASRDGANVIIFGTRDRVPFDRNVVRTMTRARPSAMPPASEQWITRPSLTDGTINPGPANRRYTFDAGPGEEWARLMKTGLSREEAFVERFAINGDFAHYRGTFVNPQVVIIADPDGEDDIITARALTGARGQYFQTLMDSMGVGENYLVLKTAPFSRYAADPDGWQLIMRQTSRYREELFTKLFESVRPRLIITDGADAAREFARIVTQPPAPVVNVTRGTGTGTADGIAEAMPAINAVEGFSAARFSARMTDIPRAHLSFYARVWEGTSGDRVITSEDARYNGKAFAKIAPEWAYRQTYQMSAADIESCSDMTRALNAARSRMGGEDVPAYLSRIAAGRPGADLCIAGTTSGGGDGGLGLRGSSKASKATKKSRLSDDDITGGNAPSPAVDEVPL